MGGGEGGKYSRFAVTVARAFLIGALLLLCGNGGVTWAEKYIASGLAALLIATEPLWVVMLNWALTRRRPNTKVLFGVFIGLAGVALLIGDGLRQADASSMSLIGAGVVVLSSVAWAGGSVYVNRRPIQASTSMASGMQMLAGGSLLILLALTAGDFQRLNLANASWRSLASLVYLTVFGSLVAFTAYIWLLRNVTTARARECLELVDNVSHGHSEATNAVQAEASPRSTYLVTHVIASLINVMHLELKLESKLSGTCAADLIERAQPAVNPTTTQTSPKHLNRLAETITA